MKLSKIILKKDDKGELLRHTSYFGIIVPQEKIVEWKRDWFEIKNKEIK